jgi:hypothetical protein
MKTPFEKFMTYVIAAIFALALIADTILELNGINIPGLFSLSLGVCSGLFLIVVLKKEERSILELVLVSLSTVISFASGIYQIFA